MPINAETLKMLRERRNLSQDALAERSRVAKKTISRIETGEVQPEKVRTSTIGRLAKALEVDIEMLAKPLSDYSHVPKSLLQELRLKRICFHLRNQTVAAYDLVEYRYKVRPHDLIEMAPLLFTLLAEKSLAFRREKLQAITEAAAQLAKMREPADHLSFLGALTFLEPGLHGEEQSIAAADIFGENVAGDTYEYGYDTSVTNPFAAFLQDFSRGLDDSAVSINDVGAQGYFMGSEICRSEIEYISGGNEDAASAIWWGHVRIPMIPEALMSPEHTEERRRWILQNIPEDDGPIKWPSGKGTPSVGP